MKYFYNLNTKTLLLILIFLGTASHSSEFVYTGPKLEFNYTGPMIIDNSQMEYTASDRLTFYTKDYLTESYPHLLPFKEAIDTWSAMHSIHPKVLVNVVEEYFKNKTIDDSINNKQKIFQMATGIKKTLNQFKGDPLAASIAVSSIANAYNFTLKLDQNLASKRILSEHNYFRGNQGPPLFSYFQPPWPRGEVWTGGGVHTNTGSGNGARNSLDFFANFVPWGGDTSNLWVSAAESGIVRVFSSCFVQVVHSNGWVTGYYHLDNVLVNDFQDVSSNQRLSNYADNLAQATCQGGSSTGPHVHYSKYYDGDSIEIDEPNVDFTSWKHKAGEGNYDSNCSRSIYTLLPQNTTVCPFFINLPNNTTAGDLIYSNGFEQL
ncbi:MAG: M23 family metallopeptidase [Marinicellaceae bacterium]